MRAKKLISAAFVLVLIAATTPAIAQSPRGGNNYPYWSGYNTYPYSGAYNPNRSGYNTYPYPGAYPNRGGYNSYPYSGAYPNTGGYNSYNAYPYNRGYNFPRKKRKNNWMPFDGGPWGDWSGPWDSGPWNPDWDQGTWGRDNDFWGSGPDGWTDPEDPKGSMSRFWDDMLKAPYEFGEMPGGWTAPSISVPNPVEVGDEFEGSSRLAPKEAAEQMNNFRYN